MEAGKQKLDDFISASLVGFVNDQLGSNGLESLDEIVLGYVTTVVDELAWDGNSGKAISVDQQDFCEIMCLYVPQFVTIPRHVVSKWILELGDQVRKSKYPEDQPGKTKEDNKSCAFVNFLQKIGQEGSYTYRTRRSSESHSSSSSDDSFEMNETSGSNPLVNEMDYDASSSSDEPGLVEPLRVLKLYKKHQSSDGRTASSAGGGLVAKKRSAGDASLDVIHTLERKDEGSAAQIKDQILARYGMVDENSDRKEHKPKMPKPEPVKLIRYREGQIVSTSGKKIDEIKAAKKQHSKWN